MRMADPKKIGFMMADLKKMRKELVPNEGDDPKSEAEMKNMDKFQKKKRELNGVLRKLREDTAKLTELKKRLGENTRDGNCIRLLNENNKGLQQASEMWQDLKGIYADDQKKRAKKLGEKELSDRNKQIALLGQELVSISQQSSRVKAAAPGTVDELDEATRNKSRTQKQRQERTDRLNKRKQRKVRTKGTAIELNDDDFRDAAPMSAQEQEFMDQVQANVGEQNEMLDTIGKGLDELKELSLDMNKQLTLQNEMINEVGNEMEKAIDEFQSANGKLKDILAENGGMTRWCPTLVCGCLLLALIGYLFNMF